MSGLTTGGGFILGTKCFCRICSIVYCVYVFRTMTSADVGYAVSAASSGERTYTRRTRPSPQTRPTASARTAPSPPSPPSRASSSALRPPPCVPRRRTASRSSSRTRGRWRRTRGRFRAGPSLRRRRCRPSKVSSSSSGNRARPAALSDRRLRPRLATIRANRRPCPSEARRRPQRHVR